MPQYQLVHSKFYCDLNGRPIMTGEIHVIQEFAADDETDARGIAGDLMLSGLAQEYPLPDVDEWLWEVRSKI